MIESDRFVASSVRRAVGNPVGLLLFIVVAAVVSELASTGNTLGRAAIILPDVPEESIPLLESRWPAADWARSAALVEMIEGPEVEVVAVDGLILRLRLDESKKDQIEATVQQYIDSERAWWSDYRFAQTSIVAEEEARLLEILDAVSGLSQSEELVDSLTRELAAWGAWRDDLVVAGATVVATGPAVYFEPTQPRAFAVVRQWGFAILFGAVAATVGGEIVRALTDRLLSSMDTRERVAATAVDVPAPSAQIIVLSSSSRAATRRFPHHRQRRLDEILSGEVESPRTAYLAVQQFRTTREEARGAIEGLVAAGTLVRVLYLPTLRTVRS